MTDLERLASLLSEDVIPVVPPPPPKIHRLTAADRWNAMTVPERLDVLFAMGKANAPDQYKGWEAIDTRFGNLLYGIQELVEAHLK